MNHSHHHLKAYLVFLAASIIFVGLLAYLYTPFNFDTSKYLNSQALISGEEQISAEVLVTEKVDSDTTAKRMRYTALLLRYQKELQDIQSQTTTSSLEVTEKMEHLQNKIENIEKIIQELAE